MKKVILLAGVCLMLTSCDYAMQRVEERVGYTIDSVVNSKIDGVVRNADSTISAKADSAIRTF